MTDEAKTEPRHLDAADEWIDYEECTAGLEPTETLAALLARFEAIGAATANARIGRLESALRELLAAQDAIDDARPAWTAAQMHRLAEAHGRAKEALR